jgi:L-threonylcarbamoyladenylate synthase
MEIRTTEHVDSAAYQAARVLSTGGIVLYPTDTVYGLAVDAGNVDALERLAALKGRDAEKTPLIAVADVATMERYGRMDGAAHNLASRFLPGPLTLILRATPECPPAIARPNGTVGIRIPNDSFCLALARAFGRAYTSTSANLAGEMTAATVEEVLMQLGSAGDAIELAIDGGPRASNVPSTIVSCVGEPVIVREGALSRAELGFDVMNSPADSEGVS